MRPVAVFAMLAALAVTLGACVTRSDQFENCCGDYCPPDTSCFMHADPMPTIEPAADW